MSRQVKALPMQPEPVQLPTEFDIGVLPEEFQHAILFADAHERRILVGYVADEKKVYLMTVENHEA